MLEKRITILFLFLLLTGAVLVLVLPADQQSAVKENRALAQLPEFSKATVFSGEFASGFEKYLSDNVGFRSRLTDLSAKLEASSGLKTSFGNIFSVNKDIGTGTTQKSGLLVLQDRIMEVFYQNRESQQAYIDALNRISKTTEGRAAVYSMLIPTRLSFEAPLYANIQNNQQASIHSIYDSLDPAVLTVDAYSALENHAQEYIYFRTDHHWTALGAYYGYEAFCSAAGLPPIPLAQFEQNTIPGLWGGLANQVPQDLLPKEPDQLTWYQVDPAGQLQLQMQGPNQEGELTFYEGTLFDFERAPQYSFFLSGDHPFAEITNPNLAEGKTLLLVKDSYGNALLPWLTQNYHKIIMIDPRTYWGSLEDLFSTYPIDDCLIADYIFATSFPDYCALLDGLAG